MKLFRQIQEDEDPAQQQAALKALAALADQGDPEAAGLTAATLYPNNLDRVLDYTLHSFNSPAPLARESLLIQGLRCEGGFNEKRAQEAANAQLNAADSSPAKKAVALMVLGLLSEYGGGNITVSKTKALDYFKRAAELGNPFGYTLQGRIYEFDGGNEVPADKTRALQLYKTAADLQDPHGLFLYATLKKELGEDKDWESLMRQSAKLGNEGAMADLGEGLVGKGDEKSRREGEYWLSLAMQFHNPYAYKVSGRLVEEGKIAVEHPVAVAWLHYREASRFPCGAWTGPDEMARLLPRLHTEPREVRAELLKDGIGAEALDLLRRNGANKNVREAAWNWALAPDNRDSSGSKVELLLEGVLAQLQYEERSRLADAARYADSVWAPIEALLVDSRSYFEDEAGLKGRFGQRLGRNGKLSDSERKALSVALTDRMVLANQRTRANNERLEAKEREALAEMERQRMHDSWREAKERNPNSLSEDEFRSCMAAVGHLERMDEQIQEIDSRLDKESFVIDMLKGLIQGAESTGANMQDSRRNLNGSIREYNATLKERNRVQERRESAFRRYDSDCGSRVAPKTMIEELCAGARDNSFCTGFD